MFSICMAKNAKIYSTLYVEFSFGLRLGAAGLARHISFNTNESVDIQS